MHWGPDKSSKTCTNEMGINPKTGAVFLFFNKAKDKEYPLRPFGKRA
jgi:hypothetical protein